jgi:hypothetical protein
MRKALKPGGLLIIQGLHPEAACVRDRGTETTRSTVHKPMLEKAFVGFQDMVVTEEENAR